MSVWSRLSSLVRGAPAAIGGRVSTMRMRAAAIAEQERRNGQAKTSAQQQHGNAFGTDDRLRFSPARPWSKYREIRKHPTVKLARAFVMAPIVGGAWAIEADDEAPDEAVKFIRGEMFPVRRKLLKHAFGGMIDFGWSPFEKVLGLKGDGGTGRLGILDLKPLLVDITSIRIWPDGRFKGFYNSDGMGNETPLDASEALLFTANLEGQGWYGEPDLEATYWPWKRWQDSDAGAERYDNKLAGSHWAVHYPIGKDPDGKDNFELAQAILKTLETSGRIAVPKNPRPQDQKDARDWLIELLSDSSPRQASFNDRLMYQDKLIVRSLLLPERAVLEGLFGTKADAESHTDLAITVMEERAADLCEVVNEQLVDQLLELNFGATLRGKVRVTAVPLSDTRRRWLRSVFSALLAGNTGMELLARMDLDAFFDEAGVPKAEEVTPPIDPKRLESQPEPEPGNADDPPADEDEDPAENLARLYGQLR